MYFYPPVKQTASYSLAHHANPLSSLSANLTSTSTIQVPSSTSTALSTATASVHADLVQGDEYHDTTQFKNKNSGGSGGGKGDEIADAVTEATSGQEQGKGDEGNESDDEDECTMFCSGSNGLKGSGLLAGAGLGLVALWLFP